MTQLTAPATPATPSRRTTAPSVTVTVVVIARTREDAGQVLTALLAQVRRPERVLFADGSIDGLGDTADLLAPVDDAGIDVLRSTLGPHRGVRRFLPEMVESLPRADVGRDLIWVLTSRTRPHPQALRHLVAASGPGVGLASPKLVDEDRPREIVRLGLQVTRAGRLVPEPRAGTIDQGQYDGDVDAIGAPLEGLLIDRALYERLGGHDPSLADLGGDLDLGWRSQRAGRRVVVVPTAAVAVRPTAAEKRPTAVHRRQARRVALARANVFVAPFLALWIVISSLVGGLGLLVLKRPGMAADEFTGLSATLDPRTLRSRLRRKVPREVHRGDLDSLFVAPVTARHRVVDDARGHDGDAGVAARSLEVEGGGGWLTHPLPWLVLAATAMSAWAARSITGELRHRPDSGLVGGELLGGRATGGQLWDAWRMAWHGSGWGHAVELSPANVLLAVPSLLVGWIPGIGSVHSPAGLVLSLVVITALPVAAVVAWFSARVFTTRPWVRAAAALAWVTTAPAALAVGEGRIGALLALVLLPRIAAGLVRAGRFDTRFSDIVRTALWAAVLATVAPLVGLVTVLLGLGHLVLGGAGRRARGIALAGVPLLLAGPWLLTLRDEPRLFLTGWGLTDAPVDTAPWRLALGQLPSGAPTTWWTAAVLGLGVVALLAPGARRGTWGAAAAALLGLAWAVGAPHVVIGDRPAGSIGDTEAVTPWSGTGQLVLIGAALVAILLAADLLPRGLRGSGRRGLLWGPALVLPVAAVGSGVVVGLHSYGDGLDTWRDPRPLVAVSAAEGATAARSLVIEPLDSGLRYRLVGSEPGPLVRDLALPGPRVVGEDEVAGAVAGLLGAGEGERHPSEALAENGVSHVVLVGPSEAQRRLVDTADGLGRLGSSAGTTTWAVRADITDGHMPSRARVTGEETSEPVSGTGAHAETDGAVHVPGGEQLVVAESLEWSDRVEVRADGDRAQMSTRSAIPTYELPDGTDEVSIDVGTGHAVWKIVQGVALVLALYLALPTERRPEPEREEAA